MLSVGAALAEGAGIVIGVPMPQMAVTAGLERCRRAEDAPTDLAEALGCGGGIAQAARRHDASRKLIYTGA